MHFFPTGNNKTSRLACNLERKKRKTAAKLSLFYEQSIDSKSISPCPNPPFSPSPYTSRSHCCNLHRTVDTSTRESSSFLSYPWDVSPISKYVCRGRLFGGLWPLETVGLAHLGFVSEFLVRGKSRDSLQLELGYGTSKTPWPKSEDGEAVKSFIFERKFSRVYTFFPGKDSAQTRSKVESGPLSGGENCLSYKSACRNRKIEEFVEPIRDAARFPELFSRELSFLIFSEEGKQGSKIQGH